jgi:sugar/nucleoside kinase (ribokinase family)
MVNILVIGGASSDILHTKNQTFSCAGGAGLYTAMAANRSGASVTLFAPRPNPIPENLKPVNEKLIDWFGPIVDPKQLPHFEISYKNGSTEYIKATFEAEDLMFPYMLPEDLSEFDLIHIIPIGNSQKQLAFVKECKKRGANKISAGTYMSGVKNDPDAIKDIIKIVDYFYMNLFEAKTLFGSLNKVVTEPGKTTFVTSGKDGVYIIQGDYRTHIPAPIIEEIDPTGAGDSFCGSSLVYLLNHEHPVMAARRGVQLASEMIKYIGPEALLFDKISPSIPLDSSIKINYSQIKKVSEKISTANEVTPWHFIGPNYPDVGDPNTLDYFFAATAQQFSFWNKKNNRYETPMIDVFNEEKLKGSDYLWMTYKMKMKIDSDFCSPERQANMTRDELLSVFKADNGNNPMPDIDLHLEQANSYGKDMLSQNLTPKSLIDYCNGKRKPFETLVLTLDNIGAYKEDPLRKKTGLLGLILNQRSERYLPINDGDEIAPVIDYHLMRSFLRIGMIEIRDEKLLEKIKGRQIVTEREEWEIRYATYIATEKVIELSGKSTGAVDLFFFDARKRCPEMSSPDCENCQLDSVCLHEKDLFQPVIRSSFY